MKTNLYTNKKRWKWALAVIALLIIGVSLWYTNHLVKSIAEQEVKQVRMWAAEAQKTYDNPILISHILRFWYKNSIFQQKTY